MHSMSLILSYPLHIICSQIPGVGTTRELNGQFFITALCMFHPLQTFDFITHIKHYNRLSVKTQEQQMW